jgi:hypothetical protein
MNVKQFVSEYRTCMKNVQKHDAKESISTELKRDIY